MPVRKSLLAVSPSLFLTAAALLLAAPPFSLQAQDQQPVVDFQRHVLPVFKTSCIDCHRAPYEENGERKNPKGGLRLDGSLGIMEGGSSGAAIVPGKPDESFLYEVITYPPNHDDIMPPKDGPLNANQILAIKLWIEQGANFGGWEGNNEGISVAKVEMKPTTADTLSKSTQQIGGNALESIKSSGATVEPIAPGNPLLRVEYLQGPSHITDDHVAKLAPIGSNVTELILGKASGVTDKSIDVIAPFTKLTYLDLRLTGVTDAGVEKLSNLSHLDYLNLYGTRVTDASLPHIAKLKNLKAVYLWQTSVTPDGAEKLRQALPDAKVVME